MESYKTFPMSCCICISLLTEIMNQGRGKEKTGPKHWEGLQGKDQNDDNLEKHSEICKVTSDTDRSPDGIAITLWLTKQNHCR